MGRRAAERGGVGSGRKLTSLSAMALAAARTGSLMWAFWAALSSALLAGSARPSGYFLGISKLSRCLAAAAGLVHHAREGSMCG